ncbi:hypothetical protein ASG90_02360 [Nocardioides sp. Soil797]|nr:hypothetical protein ASG90_02360 [Nocardioides sp. Soil797]
MTKPLDGTGSSRVDVPCRVCGTPVSTWAFFAVPERAKRIVCNEHVAEPSEGAKPVTALDLWRRRVPQRFRDATLDGVPDELLRMAFTSVAQRSRGTMTRGSSGFLLTGPTGIRKTGACYALLTALVSSGRLMPNEILVAREDDWLPPMARVSRYGADARTRKQMASALSGKKILLLDDLGYGRYPSQEDQQALMLDLLERVELNDILLLVTTNLSDLDRLEAWVGPAAFSRLWERVGEIVWSSGSVDTRIGHDRRR